MCGGERAGGEGGGESALLCLPWMGWVGAEEGAIIVFEEDANCSQSFSWNNALYSIPSCTKLINLSCPGLLWKE